MLKVYKMTPADWRLVTSLRKSDVNELLARYETDDIGLALRTSIQNSNEWVKGVFKDGQCICLFGLGSCNDIGIPWTVGSVEMLKHKHFLTAFAKKQTRQMLELYPVLANYLDSRNSTHEGWLRRLGFQFAHELDREFSGVPFKYFYMRKEN